MRLDSGELVYSSDAKDYWRLSAADICAIGEYTTAGGPSVDDYFFVFVTDRGAAWYEASFYADGRDEVLSRLSKLLGEDLTTGLCHSTSWKSRVLWPKTLEGKELFTFTPEATPAGILGRIRQWFFPRGVLSLSKPVLEAVNQSRV